MKRFYCYFRNQMVSSVIILAFLAILAPAQSNAQFCGTFPELPIPQLNDIAMVSWYWGYLPNGMPWNGPVIYYNPNLTMAAGPQLTAFFQAHEYGHICLYHIQETMFVSDPYTRSYMTIQNEYEADAYATQAMISIGNYEAVRAAYTWFRNQWPITIGVINGTHPPQDARAENIQQVAAQMGLIL